MLVYGFCANIDIIASRIIIGNNSNKLTRVKSLSDNATGLPPPPFGFAQGRPLNEGEGRIMNI